MESSVGVFLRRNAGPRAARAVVPACLLLVLGSHFARAAVLTVEADGSGDYTTIQAAIDAAAHGDEILVGPGNYLERINFFGKRIAVRSTDGPGATLIDADSTGSVVTMVSFEGPSSVLEGFTLRGGIGTRLENPQSKPVRGSWPSSDVRPTDPQCGETVDGRVDPPDLGPAAGRSRAGENGAVPQFRFGGGMLLIGTSPTLRNLVVQGNSANYGGGLCATAASPGLEGCRFLKNGAGWGGGVYAESGSRPVFHECEWRDNQAVIGGGVAVLSAEAEFLRCRFIGNIGAEGGALEVFDGSSATEVQESIFWRNRAGSGSAVRVQEATVRIEDCTVAANGWLGFDRGAVWFADGGGGAVLRTILAHNISDEPLRCEGGFVARECNDIWPRILGGGACEADGKEFSLDPLFCDLSHGDLRLQTDSPCLPGASPGECDGVGALQTTCDGDPADGRRHDSDIGAGARPEALEQAR